MYQVHPGACGGRGTVIIRSRIDPAPPEPPAPPGTFAAPGWLEEALAGTNKESEQDLPDTR